MGTCFTRGTCCVVSGYDAPTAAASNDSTMMGISYAVSDAFSVAYSQSEFDIYDTFSLAMYQNVCDPPLKHSEIKATVYRYDY